MDGCVELLTAYALNPASAAHCGALFAPTQGNHVACSLRLRQGEAPRRFSAALSLSRCNVHRRATWWRHPRLTSTTATAGRINYVERHRGSSSGTHGAVGPTVVEGQNVSVERNHPLSAAG
jgi:hypothetical protein